MSVEYIPFDPTLIGKEEIIIWCPNEADHAELVELLVAHGVVWIHSETTALNRWYWNEECELTAARIRPDRHMSISPISWYEANLPNLIFMKYSVRQEVTPNVGDLI